MHLPDPGAIATHVVITTEEIVSQDVSPNKGDIVDSKIVLGARKWIAFPKLGLLRGVTLENGSRKTMSKPRH